MLQMKIWTVGSCSSGHICVDCVNASNFCRDIKSGTKIRLSKAKTVYGKKPAPVMASYSSRGPNKVQPSILKVSYT